MKGDVPAHPLRMLDWYGPMSTRLTSGDATDALSRSLRGGLEDRVWSLFCQHTNESLMDLHVHDLPATPLHRLPCQGDWQNTDSESDWTDCDATHKSTCVS